MIENKVRIQFAIDAKAPIEKHPFIQSLTIDPFQELFRHNDIGIDVRFQ